MSSIVGYDLDGKLLCPDCAGGLVEDGWVSPDFLVDLTFAEVELRCNEYADDECSKCGVCLTERAYQKAQEKAGANGRN